MKWRSRLLPKPLPFIARIAALAGIFPILGLFGGMHWKLDLFNHFQVHYAVFIGISVIVLLAFKSFRLAGFAAIFLVVPVFQLAPCFIGSGGKPVGNPVRIATFNVLTANQRYDDAVRWTRETDSDVIFLPEVNRVWARELRPLLTSHPHAIKHPVEGNFGFAFYSKLPIVSHEIIPCGKMELPLLKARLTGPSGDFILYGAHPVPPTTEFWSGERDEFLRIMADEVAKQTLPVIVTGDLNASRWSHGMKPLWDAGLIDSAQGKGAGSTWMRGHLLAVPIDHVLYRSAKDAPGMANCRKRWIGPDLGSDHRAVVAEIAW
ncbi:endonuclease/exonuclease/phosphatase family protein [Luteolibacter flavescens]|uniref:Endonuclease/exonuclease/phosphatase family protein n=1 Tax=Luteolibacter flavescens TaxID=1859460 RepID=A0ABT3FT81_9BACT|nr:endonuclease/exonuclease/phosphatase family protein [Luteolibacter flavescens]MCW1886781.1 endonuclease/exonuclease/phosphatase family protein [Luteolibacter flavescens]